MITLAPAMPGKNINHQNINIMGIIIIKSIRVKAFFPVSLAVEQERVM